MVENKGPPVIQRSLFSWVLRVNKLHLIILLLFILTLVCLRVLPLEIQKRIVNDVLVLKNINLLVLYCLIYFAAVLLTSLLKFAINWLQTLIGQRIMTEMRRELYSYILQLPLSFFRKTPPGTVSSSLASEIAPASTFIGTVLTVPLSNILSFLAFAAYLLWLNTLLGICTLAIYPLALVIVPLIQNRVNKANKKRMNQTRRMTNQITESISGIHEVHGHGAFRSEEQKYNSIIDKLLQIRVIWMLYRYGVKIVNNLFLGLGPVIVFTLGGYLLIQGEIELGSIVAFLSAQEKLYDPWKELIDFYQTSQDASVRYRKVMKTFDATAQFNLESELEDDHEIQGRVEIKNLEYSPTEGISLLDQVNLTVEAGEHLALVGYSGSGKSTLAKCVAQLQGYSKGQVFLDDFPVTGLSKERLVKNLGFVAQTPFIFSGSIDDNLMYACKAVADNEQDGYTFEKSLDDKIAVLQQTGLFVDVLRFGLNTILDEKHHQEMEAKILKIRKNFQTNFGEELADNVEFYEQDKYLFNSSIAENILFGTSKQEKFSLHNLASSKTFLNFLDKCSLSLPLLETGTEIIQQTVNILGDISPDDRFFVKTSIDSSEYKSCVEIAAKFREDSPAKLNSKEKTFVLSAALRFIPAQHTIINLQPLLEKMILTGRREFRQWCTEKYPNQITFYSDASYLKFHSVLNNIFFGKLKSTNPLVEERVNQCIVFLLIEEDLLEDIAELGLQFYVGNRGDKLSGGQQQKLAIARVLLKNPNILILDEATSALDNESQQRIQKLIQLMKGQCTVISVIHRLDMLPSYDKVAVMKAGKIIEQGELNELLGKKGMLYELIHGKKA